MATRFIELEGEIRWAKVFEENRDLTGYMGAAEATDGQLSVDMVLEDKEFQKLVDAGSAKKGRKEDDGRMSVTLKRPWNKPGMEWACGPIDVWAPDGLRWNYNEDGQIWNGSKGIVKVSVYDIKSFSNTGTRLEALTVLEVKEPEAPSGAVEEEVPF